MPKLKNILLFYLLICIYKFHQKIYKFSIYKLISLISKTYHSIPYSKPIMRVKDHIILSYTQLGVLIYLAVLKVDTERLLKKLVLSGCLNLCIPLICCIEYPVHGKR